MLNVRDGLLAAGLGGWNAVGRRVGIGHCWNQRVLRRNVERGGLLACEQSLGCGICGRWLPRRTIGTAVEVVAGKPDG